MSEFVNGDAPEKLDILLDKLRASIEPAYTEAKA